MRIEGVNMSQINTEIAQNDTSAGQGMRVKDVTANETDIFIGEKELVSAIKTTNNKLESYNRRTEFSIHEKTGDIMIKIIDMNTNEVIIEIPPEKIKDMVANMLERAGLLVDERA